MTVCRGVRGATTAAADDRESILKATRELLALMIRVNDIDAADVASVLFTTSPDLTAEYPALGARQLGWLDVPLLCGHEMAVPGSLERAVRVMLHWNTATAQADIHHVYLNEAAKLRPDKLDLPPVDMDELRGWIDGQVAHWTKNR